MKKTYKILITLLLLLTGTLAHAANITVTASRNPVALDDSFHLIYEADDSVDGDPDFSPIYEHFDVLNSSQSTNMRMVNGNWSLKKSWDLALIGKDVGRFTIPPIHFGRDISPAIQITVTNSTSPNSVAPGGQGATVPAKIFLESSVDRKTGWVQSQFIFTIRLLRTVHISSASLSEPETSDPDAIIEKISEDQYETTRNGIRYEVFERRYAIFPQKSGILKIRPLTFEGRINSTQPRTLFDQFRMSGQLKRLRSRPVEVTVKHAPANINLQDWLPAIDLELEDEWSQDTADLKAGEPVTRTITLRAAGLTGIQLPDINFDEIPGIKQYPDKAITENEKTSHGITGIKQFKIALIPTAAGSYTVPAITVKWFNTRSGKEEAAVLPPVQLKVTGTAATAAPPPAATQPQAVTPAETPPPQPAPATLPTEPAYWKWLALFFAGAWLITLLLLLKKSGKRKNGAPEANKTTSAASVNKALSKVTKYAKQNDARQTRDALIEWARLNYKQPHISSLLQITDYCSENLRSEIRELNQAL
ncbi:MAG TPA: protein BatD, partial [Gammaproteobacteria bacterium]|nr:protein BatD [Gammaproteobacteria bacterium]